VVRRSLDAGVNPIFSLAIWIHESGASNYELSVGCKVQDFGYNIPSLASDFDSQIKAFLRLPYRYVYDVAPQCFQKDCSMEQFARLYQNAGGGDICVPNDKAVAYTESIKNIAKIIAPNCDFPRYPTEITCK
jgi:hypothetical protein